MIAQSHFSDNIRDFFPGYFGLVMASGILSIGCQFLQIPYFPIVLFYINVICYIVIWIINLIRLFQFRDRMWSDLKNHAKGPTFFTVVAATCVLGSQFIIIRQSLTSAWLLWLLGLILWGLLIYVFFAAVTVSEPKPELENSLSGAWLIIVVSTQSISVLGSLISPHLEYKDPIAFFSFCMYLLGCMLYIPIITLIIYRWTFLRMTALQLTPPYWINMGALAITTLAGSRLIINSAKNPLLAELSPFLKGFTFFFWATGTWWIPLLLILGAWRHIYQKVPLRYDPQYWGMVFPLGMYATATYVLGQSTHVPYLHIISLIFIYSGLAAWMITFAGMMKSIARLKKTHHKETKRTKF